ncbi:MAG: SbcC/MukB-like Walker B domain-containing protein, partial [Bullifex sp.]
YLDIREKDNPYKDFLTSYLNRCFSHTAVSGIDEQLKRDNALLKSGVVSDGEKKSRSEETKPSYLGWDNRKRREELALRIEGQKAERTDLLLRMKDAEQKISKANRTVSLLEQLAEFESWKDIDTSPYEERIDEVTRKRKEFLMQHKDLEEKEKLKKREEERKTLLDEENYRIAGNIRELENRLSLLNEKASGFRTKLSALDHDTAECMDVFLASAPECRLITDLDGIRITHDRISSELRNECEAASAAEAKARRELEHRMQAFINPPVRQGEEALSWQGEYGDLVPEADNLSDFEAVYLKIKDDEIEELRNKFDQYLTVSLKQSVGNLNERIRSWNREIHDAIRILNRNLMKIPFDKTSRTHLQLEMKPSADKDHREFERLLQQSFPDVRDIISDSEEKRKQIYEGIKTFLDHYRKDDALRDKVLDLRRKYVFSAREVSPDGSTKQFYQDTGALSGGEKAKLTYTILAASIAYQFNLDDADERKKGPFRFVILDEAFSKSDAKNSEYALALFKELDIQLMVITPRNGINIVEGYVSSLHLLEKNDDGRTSRVSSMTIEEYREAGSADA